jgi:hypothetical protein
MTIRLFQNASTAAMAALCLLQGCTDEIRVMRQSDLSMQAYVWQRSWTPEVSTAVRQSSMLDALHVLAAEVRFIEGQPVVTRINIDWQALSEAGGEIGAVLRVYGSAATTDWGESASGIVNELATSIAAEFERAGVRLSELQIDYDCPESKLSSYTRLLRHLKSKLPTTPLCITALPSWLHQEAVLPLLAESPGYVLQVHSLHLPEHGGLITLMDTTEARQAVTRAAEIGIPFRVALPTYSCVVEYDKADAVIEVHGEDVPTGLSLSNRRFVVLDSDAFAITELVQEWRHNATEQMQAIIWYRLPVATDRLNWPTETFHRIVSGDVLKREWQSATRVGVEGQLDVVLRQQGDAPDDLPTEIMAEWKGGMAMAADGLRGYTLSDQGAGWARFRLAEASRFGRVWPDQEIVIGWVRLPRKDMTAKVKIVR